MYKYPANANRVKDIRNKFESIQLNAKEKIEEKPRFQNGPKISTISPSTVKVNTKNLNTAPKENVHRQLSDPSKCNIKRKPAFRLEKTEKPAPFTRNSVCNKSDRLENKIKQYNDSVKNNNHKCVQDGNHSSHILDKENIKNKSSMLDNWIQKETTDPRKNQTDNPEAGNVKSNNNQLNRKPPLIKSKSSIDFANLRRKFDNKSIPTDVQETAKCDNPVMKPITENKTDLSLLYTEPIPKALRIKNTTGDRKNEGNSMDHSKPATSNCDNKNIHTVSTLKISEAKITKTNCDRTAELTRRKGLTDTLQKALTRPLPSGPPPQKPPRTFVHSPLSHTSTSDKNSSFLHSPPPKRNDDETPKVKTGTLKVRSDPKYMLNKLENALRNNRLRAKKPTKMDISTSGEDSDDSVLFKSKSKPPPPASPKKDTTPNGNIRDMLKTSSFDNLFSNCFNPLSCSASQYSDMSLLVKDKKDEPVYAEPFKFPNEDTVKSNTKENHLFYLVSSCNNS